MRFSSIFPPTTALPEARREEPPPAVPLASPVPPTELPEELDARVRLVGEWQLDEGWA